MMRRLFWLGLGAVLGVSGYRKVTAIARSLRPAPRPSALAGFAADVREGMALYMERQAQPPPASTLEGHRRRGLPAGRPAASRPRPGTQDDRPRPDTHHDRPRPGTQDDRPRPDTRHDELKDGH